MLFGVISWRGATREDLSMERFLVGEGIFHTGRAGLPGIV